MKKSTGILSVLAVITALFLVNCGSSTPTGPANTATITPTHSISSTASVTPTITQTRTVTTTPTFTDTPIWGTVTGNLILPSPQEGMYWQVMVDDNMNFGDGIINMVLGVCGTGTAVPYSITATAGTYYIYALVKSASELTQPPVQGDYLGVQGTDWPAWPASANVAVSANDTAPGMDIYMQLAANNITGIITFPASADENDILLALDDDEDGSNGGVVFLTINQIPSGTGTSYGYGALCLSPGDWYLYGMVDNDASGLPGPPTNHDFVGIVQITGVDPAVPVSQNITFTEFIIP